MPRAKFTAAVLPRRPVPTADAAVRDRILAAALREFADRGYDGASTSAIARTARVTQPMVHYYFNSKAELWRATVDALFNEARAVFLGVRAELRDVRGPALLKVVLRRFVAFSARYPELARLMAREGSSPGPRLKWMVRRHLRDLFAGLEGLLRDGARAGWAKPLPAEQVVFFLIGSAAHLSAASALARELHGIDAFAPTTLDAQSDALIELVFHGLVQERS